MMLWPAIIPDNTLACTPFPDNAPARNWTIFPLLIIFLLTQSSPDYTNTAHKLFLFRQAQSKVYSLWLQSLVPVQRHVDMPTLPDSPVPVLRWSLSPCRLDNPHSSPDMILTCLFTRQPLFQSWDNPDLPTLSDYHPIPALRWSWPACPTWYKSKPSSTR